MKAIKSKLDSIGFFTGANLAYEVPIPDNGAVADMTKNETYSHLGIRWPFVQFILLSKYIMTDRDHELAEGLTRRAPFLMREVRHFIKRTTQP
jgi:hypothetical protein